MKQGGYLRTVPGSTRTGIDGVFAAGDVTDDVSSGRLSRQLDKAVMAALERFLAAQVAIIQPELQA